jgi:cob(I)alamin adenosyltransferase
MNSTSGDGGKTSLISEHNIRKDDRRIELIGQLDELSAVLGVARTEGITEAVNEILERIQRELIDLCAEIAGTAPKIAAEHIERLESEIAVFSEHLPPLKKFIIHGNDKTAAYLNFARTVCRRTERSLVKILPQDSGNQCLPLVYLNRLSTLLFTLAR